jgi:hypothetical protein
MADTFQSGNLAYLALGITILLGAALIGRMLSRSDVPLDSDKGIQNNIQIYIDRDEGIANKLEIDRLNSKVDELEDRLAAQQFEHSNEVVTSRDLLAILRQQNEIQLTKARTDLVIQEQRLLELRINGLLIYINLDLGIQFDAEHRRWLGTGTDGNQYAFLLPEPHPQKNKAGY